jgi:ubiquinone/menaquinone biosynthesis C-methylase UbiE
MSIDTATRDKWDRASRSMDLMAGYGPERRWRPAKLELFKHMRRDANILFLALGTGLDIACFPPGCTITAIDISPKMIKIAQPKIADYDGAITARCMDVHDMSFPDEHFDQVFTSCTFCSVPRPIDGLRALYRVMKPGAELHMFEHTGSNIFPFSFMMRLMSPLASRAGPELDRPTVDNVRAAGFEITAVNNVYLDTVKTIHARRPAN